MPTNYFSSFLHVVWNGTRRSIIAKESEILEQVNVLIGKEKLLVGHSRSFHSVPSAKVTDLQAFVRPGVTACAQADFHAVNRRKNLSVVGVFSRTISIPSVFGPSFQVCDYHLERVLAEPIQVLGINSQRTRMAVYGSRPTLSDCSFANITCKPAQPHVAAYHSYGGRSFEDRGKVWMSSINSEQTNNFLLYGYFIHNISKRKSSFNPFLGFEFKGFYTSSPTCSSADTAHDASFETSSGEKHHSSSTDFSKLNIPLDRTLRLKSGSCYLPHPDKEETGGEDAHFICSEEQAIGVADGVGGWADYGVNAGYYARELMSNSLDAIQDEPRGSIDPARVLEKAYASTKCKGSSTACIIALTGQGLHAINLGDSGFMVVRDGCTVFRSPVQQHDFNFTFQLGSDNGGDLPSSGQVFTIPIAPGDVVIAGTDGLFDNLYNSDITAVIVHAIRAGLSPKAAAQKVAALARQRAEDKNRQTPFSTAAQEAGVRYYGGKLDDITVVVSYIASDHDENPSEKTST